MGFIKKLPHDLVASFKSTLDEALGASLLLFVVDGSDPAFRSQLEVSRAVLAEVGVDNETPKLLVLNKRDRLRTGEASTLAREFPDSILISTRDPDDVRRLRDRILSYFERDMVDAELFIPYSVQGMIGEIRAKMRVLGESYSERGVTFAVRGDAHQIEAIRKRCEPKDPNG